MGPTPGMKLSGRRSSTGSQACTISANSSIELVAVAVHLEGGGLVVLYELGLCGLFSRLSSDLVTGLDLAICITVENSMYCAPYISI